MATSVALQPHQIRRAAAALVGIKAIHTLAWFSIESCMIYLLYAGLRKRSERRAAIAATVVGAESLLFAANGFRCPLTNYAEQLGAKRGSVTDIFLPRSLAHNLPALHVPLLLLAAFLHLRNLRIDRSASPAVFQTAAIAISQSIRIQKKWSRRSVNCPG